MLVMEQEELLTPRQIAERYQVTPHTIRRYIREGKLEAIKFGDQYRIPKRALEKFLAERNKQPDSK